MTKALIMFCLALVIPLVAAPYRPMRAQEAFEQVSGKAFDSAVPRDFYLEGDAIPTEKRNAVLLKNLAGARVLLALIDTSGYSSQVQKKYTGMIIAEGRFTIWGNPVEIGSDGFGLDRPLP